MAESPAQGTGEGGEAMDGSIMDVEALQAEVQKWQERVPKLASALRERSEELEAARVELREMSQSGAQNVDSAEVDRRLQARSAHIEELEAKLTELTSTHRTTAGELHTLKLTLKDAETEAAQWKHKWQEGSNALDAEATEKAALQRSLNDNQQRWQQERASLAEDHQRALSRAEKDLDGVKKRNAQLKETTEFANKQIETLRDELQQLMTQATSELAERTKLEGTLEEERSRGSSLETQLAAQETQSQFEVERTVSQQQQSELNQQLADLGDKRDCTEFCVAA